MVAAEPKALADLYRRFYDLISDLGAKHKCVFDKLQGDGGMFVGGVSSEDDTPEEGACRAARFALELCRNFRNVVVKWHRTNSKEVVLLPDVRVGVGIHVGAAFAGLLENNTRLEFIAFGDEVNVTQRIESAAARGKGDVLVSARVRELIEDRFVIGPLESFSVKDGDVVAAPLLDEREPEVDHTDESGIERLASF